MNYKKESKETFSDVKPKEIEFTKIENEEKLKILIFVRLNTAFLLKKVNCKSHYKVKNWINAAALHYVIITHVSMHFTVVAGWGGSNCNYFIKGCN